MDGKHGRTTSVVKCHHHLWAAHTVGRRRAWHDLTALGQRTQLDYVGRGMTSPPLDSAHSRTTSSATCYHLLLKANTVERRRAWHAIITFGQHKWSNDVGHGIPSCLWEAHTVERRRAWYEITALGLHAWLDYGGRGMTSPPLDSTHSRTTRGMA